MTVNQALPPRKLTLYLQRKRWSLNQGWIIENNAPDNTGALRATRIERRGQIGNGYKIALPAHVHVSCWVNGQGRFWISPDDYETFWFDLKPGWNQYDAHVNSSKATGFAIGGKDLLIGEVTVRWAPI
jgi:hypothetical protein